MPGLDEVEVEALKNRRNASVGSIIVARATILRESGQNCVGLQGRREAAISGGIIYFDYTTSFPAAEKVLERLMAVRQVVMREVRGYGCDEHYGYRECKSTEGAICVVNRFVDNCKDKYAFFGAFNRGGQAFWRGV